jgi:hypothetical protein
MSESISEACRRLAPQGAAGPKRSARRTVVKWAAIVAVCLVVLFVGLSIAIRPAANQANQAYQGASQNLAAAQQAASVSLAKYDAIQTGMSLHQVQSIAGWPGTQASNLDEGGTSNWVYEWQNTDGSNMNVQFQNGAVIGKAQAGLQ